MMMLAMMMIVPRSENRTMTNDDVDMRSELNLTKHHFDSMLQQLHDKITQLRQLQV